jgi:toluene monooxygenase electron transfer component
MSFALELERPSDFDAGQFVLLAPEGANSPEGYRAYSMCNYAKGGRTLDFVVKRKPGGGFSEWLFGAGREGARVDAFGPLGKATFEPGLGKNLLCIAGGSGIAGMMSILARADAAGYFGAHQGWVFFGVRTMKDAFFLEQLSRTRAQVTVALSEEDVRAYLAGPPPAVDAAIRVLLLDAKLTTDNIRYDKFS